jgi:hypothetical protein
MPPSLRTIMHSPHAPCDCLAVTLLDTNHRQNILPLFCTKPWLDRTSRFYENPSRSFIYLDELRNHVLAVPQPFAVSVCWPAKQLFLAEEYRTAAGCYRQTPDRWDSESHPYSELAPDSELYNLYNL